MFKNQDLWVSHLMLARINYVKIIHLLHHWIYQIEIHDLYLKLIDAILRQKKSSSKISSEKLICSSWYLSSRNWPVIEYDHRDGLAEHSLAHFCIKYDQGLVWFGHSSACWCIKYDPLPSLLTLINSTVWSLYSLSHGSQICSLEYEHQIIWFWNLVLESQLHMIMTFVK